MTGSNRGFPRTILTLGERGRFVLNIPAQAQDDALAGDLFADDFQNFFEAWNPSRRVDLEDEGRVINGPRRGPRPAVVFTVTEPVGRSFESPKRVTGVGRVSWSNAVCHQARSSFCGFPTCNMADAGSVPLDQNSPIPRN